ncbi:peptide chain release factor 3 [Motilimonas pumila]|uniref:Peptide chain release factor 3 n=1 Tax=Motilimonas pumila TaxID=2303987 RepID=A0A418YKW3_9GAMM|nr:peptide chain release factor 3 [Motilimonas pumila]
MSNSILAQEVASRRTFAIISHPDAAQPFNA